MKTSLLTQLKSIRFHLGVVFDSLKVAKSSLDEVAETMNQVKTENEPKLKLVVDNEAKR